MTIASLNNPTEKALGSVVTFYSFKGGVGRSMALANIAVLLARAGKKVLCLDWDLEAPGLDRYFGAVPFSNPEQKPLLSSPEIAGGLLAILKNSTQDELAPWKKYSRSRESADRSVTLEFIGSGEETENYSTHLADFSWARFFSEQNGGEIIEALRNEWKAAYDFILIDSRTGLTDASGVCTIQMPDILVLLFAANQQNVDWCGRVADGIRKGRRALPYDRAFLPIVPVLARFDASEERNLATAAKERIASSFDAYFRDWLPRGIEPREMLNWSLLPYVPLYSFEEALAVEDEPPSGALGLSFYYDLLAKLIQSRFQNVRSILAEFNVPGAVLPPLLPSVTELRNELSTNSGAAVAKYQQNILERAEIAPEDAVDALENLALFVSHNDAEKLLADAIRLFRDHALAQPEKVLHLMKLRADALLALGRKDEAEQCRVQANELATTYYNITDITADNGSIGIGVNIGSNVTVYNLSVSDAIIRKLAQGVELPKQQAEKLTGYFLNDIVTYYRYLPLKGMGKNDQVRLNFPLVNLFIPLNALLILPKGDALSDEQRSIAGRKLGEQETEELRGHLDKATPVLDLIIEYPVLVILGDPGSGKSTVVRFLAYILATGQAYHPTLQGYLPLLLPLSAYSEKLAKDSNLSLYRFAIDYFQARMDLQDLDKLLDSRLNQGKVLILLDGLDEVKDKALRNTVVDRVQQFLCRWIQRGNRVIMTSRIVGYKEVRPPAIAELRECTLLDFDDTEIEEFIHRWTENIEAAVYEQQSQAQYEARREARELITAIAQNQGIRKLASTPLLLTMLVIQKRQGVELPRHRVMLYEQYIQSLLRDWLLARGLHSSRQDLPDDLLLRRILEPLAWWLQTTQPGKGLVNEAELYNWLIEKYKGTEDPRVKARQFIDDVRGHSGLLIDRGDGQYGFMHLTFMEYLAGVALADRFQTGLSEVLSCIIEHAGEAEWQETLLLAISYLGIKQKFAPATTALLEQLLGSPSSIPGTHFEIVAAALADMGQSGVTTEAWQILRQSLVSNGLRSQSIPADKRVKIGQNLARLGDPRASALNVDNMEFCFIPAGEFFLGSTDADKLARDNEKKNAGKTIRLGYDYAIGKYPITVAQFRQSGIIPKDENALQGLDNNPVVYVTWHEAIAFCDWLSNEWKDKLPKSWRVDLASEREWEKAARGGLEIPVEPRFFTVSALQEQLTAKPLMKKNDMEQRLYPWGKDINNDRLNYNMAIGSVSAVGCYPQGKSPYGTEDMSGNVWEWTRSIYESSYPENEAQWSKSEQRGGEQSRVLRGGAFDNFSFGVRCAVRDYYRPSLRDLKFGFRVVLSPLSLSSDASDR